MRFSRVCAFFWTVFCLLVLSAPAMGQSATDQRTLTVIGEASLEGKDPATARQEAVDDALKTAVDVAAAELMGPDDAATRFPAINQIILGNETDYVQTYQVLSEGSAHRNRLRVPVTATVALAPIRQQLDALTAEAPPSTGIPSRSGAPRLLILLAEQKTERGPVHYWWREEEQAVEIIAEASMADILSTSGFTVIPHEALFQDPRLVARIRFNPYIEPGDAAVVGRNIGADVVIVGTAVARRSLNVMGEEERTFSATVSVRAFSTQAAQEIAEVVETSVESGTDEVVGRRAALGKAGRECGRKLAGTLTSVLSGPAAEEGIRVIVGGTRNLGSFVMFRRELRQLAGVDAIRLKEMRSNEALLQVDYQGDGAALARAIREKRFEAFSVKLHEAAGGEVRLELVSP
jgi:hypothetical protein